MIPLTLEFVSVLKVLNELQIPYNLDTTPGSMCIFINSNDITGYVYQDLTDDADKKIFLNNKKLYTDRNSCGVKLPNPSNEYQLKYLKDLIKTVSSKQYLSNAPGEYITEYPSTDMLRKMYDYDAQKEGIPDNF